MRGFMTFLAACAVVALGYWAYHQNILTQQSLREVDRLQRDIGRERENLGVLRAEWAYLNRPDRLRELVDLNFDRLGLLPMSPDQFAVMDEVVWRPASPRMDATRPEAENILFSASQTEEPL